MPPRNHYITPSQLLSMQQQSRKRHSCNMPGKKKPDLMAPAIGTAPPPAPVIKKIMVEKFKKDLSKIGLLIADDPIKEKSEWDKIDKEKLAAASKKIPSKFERLQDEKNNGSKINRPPSEYSNTSPYGIAAEIRNSFK